MTSEKLARFPIDWTWPSKSWRQRNVEWGAKEKQEEEVEEERCRSYKAIGFAQMRHRSLKRPIRCTTIHSPCNRWITAAQGSLIQRTLASMCCYNNSQPLADKERKSRYLFFSLSGRCTTQKEKNMTRDILSTGQYHTKCMVMNIYTPSTQL